MSDAFERHVKANRKKLPKRRKKKPKVENDWTTRASEIIRWLAPGREINADDLIEQLGKPPHRNSAGGLFQHFGELGILHDTGNTVVSARPEARGRRIRVWRKA